MPNKASRYTTKDVNIPYHGATVYTDTWWVCIDGDSSKALFYDDRPQCSKDKQIVEFGIKNGTYTDMKVGLVFIEVAYITETRS